MAINSFCLVAMSFAFAIQLKDKRALTVADVRKNIQRTSSCLAAD